MAKISLNDISSSFQTMITQNLEPSSTIKTIAHNSSEDTSAEQQTEDTMTLMDKIALEMQRGV